MGCTVVQGYRGARAQECRDGDAGRWGGGQGGCIGAGVHIGIGAEAWGYGCAGYLGHGRESTAR